MAKDIYKQFGVDKSTAKPGDLLNASRNVMMKKPKKATKSKKPKNSDKETKKEERGESKMDEKREVAKMMKHKDTKKSKKPKLGTGKRFSQLTKKLAGKGVNNPKALAAWIGRKKFGSKKFAALSAKGGK